jgi:hypothetical protein
MRWGRLSLVVFLVCACSSKPVLPAGKSVTVSRETAAPRCRELGPVRGNVLSVHGKAEDALLDMQKEAAEKGANYVVVHQYSGEETAVTGVAYDCP